MKTITFPAMDIPSEAKIKRLIDTMKEYMDIEIKIETVTVMKIKFPEDRVDAETVLNSIKKCMEKKFGGL